MDYDLSGRTIFEIPEYQQLERIFDCFLPEFPSLRALSGATMASLVEGKSFNQIPRLSWLIRNTPDSPHMRRGNGGLINLVQTARFAFFEKKVLVRGGLELRPQIGSVVFLVAASHGQYYFLVDSLNSYACARDMLTRACRRIRYAFGFLPMSGAFSADYRSRSILCYRPALFCSYEPVRKKLSTTEPIAVT